MSKVKAKIFIKESVSHKIKYRDTYSITLSNVDSITSLTCSTSFSAISRAPIENILCFKWPSNLSEDSYNSFNIIIVYSNITENFNNFYKRENVDAIASFFLFIEKNISLVDNKSLI